MSVKPTPTRPRRRARSDGGSQPAPAKPAVQPSIPIGQSPAGSQQPAVPGTQPSPIMASQPIAVVEFKMNAKDLPDFARKVTMSGQVTDSREEKRKKSNLFSEFFGRVNKEVHDDVTDRFSKGAIDIIMSNSTGNVFGRLVYNVLGVKTEGVIWCGDTIEFARICNNINMSGEVIVKFSGAKIEFITPDVDLEMRNDEISTLETKVKAEEMLSRLDMSSEPIKYRGEDLPTTVTVDIKKLVPVVSDANLVGQLHYPVSVKKYTEDGQSKYYLHVESKKSSSGTEKININRKIKEITVDGEECSSSYSVGLDSAVVNLDGKVMIRMGEWKPMVIEANTEKYKYVFVIANLVRDNEETGFDYENDIFSDEEEEGSEEEAEAGLPSLDTPGVTTEEAEEPEEEIADEESEDGVF